jgi:hypothetical protein
VARYDEILKVQQMDAEVNAVTGEYAWARVHAARENSIRIQVRSFISLKETKYEYFLYRYTI